MSYAAEMRLAKAVDRHRDLDEQIFQNEMKLSKAQRSIKEGLDSTGEIQRRADELMQKIADQKEQLAKLAELVAILETEV
jgi:predicted transcriptional regulator